MVQAQGEKTIFIGLQLNTASTFSRVLPIVVIGGNPGRRAKLGNLITIDCHGNAAG